MPRKKKTPIDIIADHIEQYVTASNKGMINDLRESIPDLIVRAFGLPSASEAIADHVSRLVTSQTRRSPRKAATTSTQKAAKAETSGTSQRVTRTKRKTKVVVKAKRKATKIKAKATKVKATKVQAKSKAAPKKASKKKAVKAKARKAPAQKTGAKKTKAPSNGAAASAYADLRKRAIAQRAQA